MPSQKVHLRNRGDGSYVVVSYISHNFLGIVRKINKYRWTCAPLGAGVEPNIEVTEHTTRSEAVERLART